jgi:tRNA 2-thiouridine synthesizing protein A
MTTTPARSLDAKGLTCPLPVLRARKLLKDLAPGEVLEVEATDPSAPKDFHAFCEASGNRLLVSDEAGGVYRFRIERAA